MLEHGSLHTFAKGEFFQLQRHYLFDCRACLFVALSCIDHVVVIYGNSCGPMAHEGVKIYCRSIVYLCRVASGVSNIIDYNFV